MVGRAQAGIEDQVELGALRCRFLQHADRLPGEEQFEGPRAVFAVGPGRAVLVDVGDVIHQPNMESN